LSSQVLGRLGSDVGRALCGEGEDRGHPSRQVGADRLARVVRAEDRPVLDRVVRVAGGHVEPVVGLGQPPHVVIRPYGLVARADADLGVEGPAVLVPHPVQPGQPVRRLGRQFLHVRQVALREQQFGDRVGGGAGELEEVPRVEPAARDVGPVTGRGQPLVEQLGALLVVVRIGVDGRVLVGQMGGPVRQAAGKHVGSVALCLQEADVVPDERGHQLVGVGDPEGGGAAGRGPGQDDAVGAGGVQRGEVGGAHGGVLGVPAADGGSEPPRRDHFVLGVDDLEARSRESRLGPHDVGLLRLAA
jgi:hypothetical protein